MFELNLTQFNWWFQFTRINIFLLPSQQAQREKVCFVSKSYTKVGSLLGEGDTYLTNQCGQRIAIIPPSEKNSVSSKNRSLWQYRGGQRYFEADNVTQHEPLRTRVCSHCCDEQQCQQPKKLDIPQKEGIRRESMRMEVIKNIFLSFNIIIDC